MADEPRGLPVPQARPGAASNVGMALPQVPGRIIGGTSIQVAQNGLVWTVNLKIGELGQAPALDFTKTWVAAWLDDADVTYRVSLSTLSATLPVEWANITNKPATFPPTLPIPSSGITGLDAALASIAGDLSSLDARLDIVEPIVATHTSQISTINGKLADADRGDITTSASFATWTIDANAVTVTKMQQLAGLSVLGNGANGTANMAAITAGTDGFVLRRSGTAVAFGTVATAGIANDAVDNTKLANMANGTIKGRVTAATGDPEDLTGAQATSLLTAFAGDAGAGGTKGIVPAPAAGDAAASKFLAASGGWVAVPALTDGDKGDITVSGSGTTWSIDARAVTFGKTPAVSTQTMLGRNAAGSGDIESLAPSVARAIMAVAAQVAAKSGAYSVVAADYGKSFVATGSASWTFALLAAATATSDFWCEICNSGTGKVTIDPNGSETVNGATTLVLYPGETVKLLCDGANWHALFGRSEVLIAGTSLAGTGAAVASIDEALPADFIDFELNANGFAPVTAAAALGLRFSLDGGATYLSAGYYWFNEYVSNGTPTNPAAYLSSGSSVWAATGIELTAGTITTANTHNALTARIMPGRAASLCPTIQGEIALGNYSQWISGGYYAAFGRATNFRLMFSSTGGNIAAGVQYTLVGRRPIS